MRVIKKQSLSHCEPNGKQAKKTPEELRFMVRLSTVCLLVLLVVNCGCTPAGPRALLKGEALIQQGKYQEAIQQLQTAVRLLPTNAQAWNHLGLAYHGHKQPELAIKAYRQALASNKNLAAARYNLGCLLLEENKTDAAIQEFTSFVLLQPRSGEGHLKLGTGYLRGHKLDYAEREFRLAMELQPQNPEVFNGLGMIQLQRRRYPDALGYFSQALQKSSNYAPAILNAAVAEQTRNNYPAALKHYRQYLALQPRPENWGSVLAVANKLDADLNAPVVKAGHPAFPPFTPQTNPPPAQSNVVYRPAVTASPPVIVSLPKTNPPARTNMTKGATALLANSTTKTSSVSVAAPSNPPTRVVKVTPPPEVVKPAPPAPKPSELEVTPVGEEMVIRPAHDVAKTASSTSAQPSSNTITSDNGGATTKPGSPDEKRGFLSGLNPFRTRTKPSTSTTEGSEDEPGDIARYAYVSPARPAAGKRSEAEPYFLGGVKMHQSSKWVQALAYYQKAIELDPAYYEVYYNKGLAAYEARNWKEALKSYEYALALKADSVDARYNFALTLKQAGYVADAVNELKKIVQAHDSETRAHFSLANLYAKNLNQPALAREHYLKVLHNDPQHPNGAEIRYWLAAHP